MSKRKLWLPGAAFWSALAILLFATQGFAAAAGANGLRVSPVITNLTINPGTTQTVNVNVTNVTAETTTFQAIFNDFTASPDESGQPELILGSNQYASSHSLKHFVQAIPNFTLQPGQETAVPVKITIPLGTPGGGYYGAVRFGPASSGGNQTVTLSGSVGSLILVTVPGNIVNKLSIAGFSVANNATSASSFFTSNKDISAIVQFQNEGNVQEEPFGKILLKNHSGKTLSTMEVNNIEPPGNVLPNSIRKFSVPITGIGSFGIYKIEGNFGYGTDGQLLSASTTFYVVPVSVIVIFIIIVALLVFLVFGLPKLIKSYNQRVIRKASRRR